MIFHRCQGLIARARGLIKVASVHGCVGPLAGCRLPVVTGMAGVASLIGLAGLAIPASGQVAEARIADRPAAEPVPLDEPTVPSRIGRLITDLDASSLDVREQAQAELGDRERCSLASIQDRLFDPTLSEEQRLRLQSAGFTLFCTTVRGAMGVNILGTTPQGIVIGATVEGFDSRLVLQPGDVIRSIAGRPVADQPEFQASIVSHDPNDEVLLNVLRKGEALTLTVRLGPYYKLGNQRRFGGLEEPWSRVPDERTLDSAWRVRLGRMAKIASAQLPTPIDTVNVQPDDQVIEPAAPVAARINARELDELGFAATSLVAGGEPRNGTGWSSGMFVIARGAGALQLNGDPMLVAQVELELAQQRRDQARLQIQGNRAIIDDPQTPAELRRDLILQNVVLEDQLRRHEDEVRQAQQRLTNSPQRDRRFVP